MAAEPGWAWLRERAGLSDVELDVVLIALGPEVDPRYERIYGYLQDDVTRRWPTVGLALDLLSDTAERRLANRSLFGPEAPLAARHVLRLVADPAAVAPPLPAHGIVLDPQVVAILLALPGLDPRLAACARLAASSTAGPGVPRAVRPVLNLARAPGRPALRLYLRGRRGAGKLPAAGAIAAAAARPLLTVDVGRLPVDGLAAAGGTLDETVDLLVREADRQGAVLYLPAIDDRADGGALASALVDRLARHDGDVILAGAAPWPPPGVPVADVVTVPLDAGQGGHVARRADWGRQLAAYGARPSAREIDTLARRFRLTPGQISDAVRGAVTAASLRGAGTPAAPTAAELFAAARGQTGHHLATLARRIEPAFGWADIVLPPDTAAQLRELCDRLAHRSTVLSDWGFDRLTPHGAGITALFAGPPGTGKTMAAEVVARELGLELYRVDLATVVSKYIGETEKNLEQIFTAAADTDAVLLFDEADALFGRRSEVRDAHDRYANLEVAYLLQRLERHDGVVILATNLRGHVDEAFTRRMQFVVDFPLPDVAERRAIWRACLPPRAPLADDVDLDLLAAGYRLAGGHIRNITLAAAFRAAAASQPIRLADLVEGARREHQKLGRVPPAIPAAAGLPAPAAQER